MPKPDPMVTPAWLAERLGAPNLAILDATWFMPGDARNPLAMHQAARIPGARHFDIDAIADPNSPLPHMLPSPEAFQADMRALGIKAGATIVVYDAVGLFSAPRVWWSLRAMGTDEVYVLDGGLPAWQDAGHAIETGATQPPTPGDFIARYDAALVADFAGVQNALAQNVPVLDARPAGRFRGEEPEPRPGLASGHMPGAVNIPWSGLIAADGRLRAADELRHLFTFGDIARAEAPIATCGSGVSAAIIALALARLGRWDASIYDGSWAEWGALGNAPVAKGASKANS
jgi:thiosulfate/3-mercaptopyruvate sulfurtransferase